MEKLNFQGLGPEIKEEAEPVKNLIETFDKIYYSQGTVTHRSRFGRSEENPKGMERPLFTRAHRATLFKRLKNTDKESRDEREAILIEAKMRDNINEQYLTQKDVTVNIAEYGEQRSRVVDIDPYKGMEDKEEKKFPPIFLIPGISNDVECVSSFITEVAYNGRRIITAGYPESFMGNTTEKFAEAVEKDSGFNPHIKFYKGVIDKLFTENEEIEIWGFSTGGPIASGILSDEKYQKRTSDAALLFPAAIVDQKLLNLKLGAVKDLGFMKDKSSASLNLTIASKSPKEKGQLKLRTRIMGSLMKKISKANSEWKNAHVKEGGHIIVISGGNDMVTKSASMNEEFEKVNSQIKSTVLKEAYHSTIQVDPESVVWKIFEMKQ